RGADPRPAVVAGTADRERAQRQLLLQPDAPLGGGRRVVHHLPSCQSAESDGGNGVCPGVSVRALSAIIRGAWGSSPHQDTACSGGPWGSSPTKARLILG